MKEKVCLNCTIRAPNGTFLRHQVKYRPGPVRDESMLDVPLETESNTVERSSSAEHSGPIVCAICKMISGNFKGKERRRERINKASFSISKQINLQRQRCADLSKAGARNGSAAFLFVQVFQKRRVNWLLLKGHNSISSKGEKLETKQILSDSPSGFPSRLLATPEHWRESCPDPPAAMSSTGLVCAVQKVLHFVLNLPAKNWG